MAIFRIVALDIGDKRIGVAATDPFNEYAVPGDTYFRTRDFAHDVAAIVDIARAKGAGLIVCGLPLNADGTESEQTEKTKQFVQALRQICDLPVEWEDERFTTLEARETQMIGGVKRGKRKQSIDSIAAACILEGYLARRKKQERNQRPQGAL